MQNEPADEMMKVISTWLLSALDDDDRKERVNQRMLRTLLKGLTDAELPHVPAEETSPHRKGQEAVIEGFIALYGQVSTIRECQYYFRRYPFRGLPLNRAQHLTNCCEMYFDRVVQFRDRMKVLLNSVKQIAPQREVPVSKALKVFDKIFNAEIRYRNHTHHHGRFDTEEIRQLSLINLLSLAGKTPGYPVAAEEVLFRKAGREWAARAEESADATMKFVHQIASIILEVCEFVQPLRPFTSDRQGQGRA